METRLVRALGAALRNLLRTFGRIARQLFHEVTGAFFAFFALAGAAGAWRERGHAVWRVALPAAFALLMLAFAVGSFRRARR